MNARSFFRTFAGMLVWSAVALSAPIVNVGPFVISYGLAGVPTFSVTGKVFAPAGGNPNFIYSYTVENLTDFNQESFFIINEHTSHAGVHHEINPVVAPGPGRMIYDDPVAAVVLGAAAHNYWWQSIVPFAGAPLAWTPHQIMSFIFDDPDGPAMVDWGLYDPNAPLGALRFGWNVGQKQGQLPVPDPDYTGGGGGGGGGGAVPEPSTFGLLLGGAVLIGVGRTRRRGTK